MKPFLNDEFLLQSPTASELYHRFAESLPIIDYHCHINPQEIAQNRRFETITQAWLGGDHYKWRLMRANGVEEQFITGDAPDREKFQKWAETLPLCAGNPLYHWTHLELKRFFGYDGILNGNTAEYVWRICNRQLQGDLTVRKMIERARVEVICTTDDPADTLEWHEALQKDPDFHTAVYPAWRPDKVLNIEKPDFAAYIQELSSVSGIWINDLDSLKQALTVRLGYFDTHGCRISDHAFERIVYREGQIQSADETLKKALGGSPVSTAEEEEYKSALMLFLGREYAKRHWVMQLHFGALRDNNRRMFGRLGPDTGYDAIAPTACSASAARLLDALEQTDELPKTILYSLNPSDNLTLGSLISCFQGPEARGKIQQGSAWWFCDTKQGMIDQLTTLASIFPIGNFVGMLTDSRSFLSYTRHEYFRRIFCNLLGGLVESGEYPADMEMLSSIIQAVSYGNAKEYFNF